MTTEMEATIAKTISSIKALMQAVPVEVEEVEIETVGRLFFRGLRENEVQRLSELGGKLKIYKDQTQEYDLSKLTNGGDLELFASGWVTDSTGSENVVTYINKKQWDFKLKELGGMPSFVFKEGAAVVRRLTGMDRTKDEADEEKNDLSGMELGN